MLFEMRWIRVVLIYRKLLVCGVVRDQKKFFQIAMWFIVKIVACIFGLKYSRDMLFEMFAR